MNNYAPKNPMPVASFTVNYANSNSRINSETIEDRLVAAEANHFPEATRVIDYIRSL